MGLLHYSNTLFLGKESTEYVDVSLHPGQRLLVGFTGAVFILLSIFETPFQWDEFFYVAIGGTMLLFALLRNRIVSPCYLRFNDSGIRGKLPERGTIKWSWEQINTIEYLPTKIMVHIGNDNREIPVGHVEQKHRNRVLDHLKEVATEHNIVVSE